MSDCIFCKIISGDIPSATVYENDEFKAILDRFPSNKGHVLIMPKEHVANIFEIDPEKAGRLFKLAAQIAPVMKETFGFENMNVVQNNGPIAGQTVNHFHLHLIPRYENDGVNVRIVMLDTPPLIDKYRQDTEDYNDAGKQDINKQLEWLDSVLTAAKEQWVLVIGHHPIYADTDKNPSERGDMQKRVDTILRKHNNVDMYICGHIHNFQHIRMKGSNIDYVVNSSGSLAREVKPVEGTKFCSGKSGFSVLSADSKELVLTMVDKDGNKLYSISRKD